MQEIECHGTGSPDVSILMTAYNTASYLPEAIDSILHQRTQYVWELLFVDDGSTDETLAIATAYAERFPAHIRVLQHEGGQNRGISASRNLALQHARGGLLTFLDSDDVWLPHHLETQARVLRTHPEVAMVYAGAERWVNFAQPFHEETSRNAYWGENYLPPLVPAGKNTGLLPPGDLVTWFQQDESMVPCICTVMVRTCIARAEGGFCDDFRGLYDDQVFHAKIATKYQVFANDICVARYRQHAASCCASTRRKVLEEAQERERFQTFLLSLERSGSGVANMVPGEDNHALLAWADPVSSSQPEAG